VLNALSTALFAIALRLASEVTAPPDGLLAQQFWYSPRGRPIGADVNSGFGHLRPSGRSIGYRSAHLHHHASAVKNRGYSRGGVSSALRFASALSATEKVGRDQKPAGHRPRRGRIYRDLGWFVSHGLRTLASPRAIANCSLGWPNFDWTIDHIWSPVRFAYIALYPDPILYLAITS